MKDAPVRHLVEYAAYLAVKGVVRTLPHTAARSAGRRLGALAWRLLGRHRRIAEDNLAHALPELGRTSDGGSSAAPSSTSPWP